MGRSSMVANPFANHNKNMGLGKGFTMDGRKSVMQNNSEELTSYAKPKGGLE